MGYSTDFEGAIDIDPPLNQKEIEYIRKFNDTRRTDRENGPYYVGAGGLAGQAHEADIHNYNSPPAEQPGLWCQWTVTDDGTQIEWDGGEKFYSAGEWMKYIIQHFLCQDPIAKKVNKYFDFLQGHTCNGVIRAYGEDPEDLWSIHVEDNVVTLKEAKVNWG